jgi:hypothetical protein
MPKRDNLTLDLLSYRPPPVPEELARGGAPRARVARMIAMTLKESSLSREEIAERVSDYLGEKVSVSSLDQCASQAREDHTISFIRAWGLAKETGDFRLFQMALREMGQAIVDERYLPAIEAEMLADRAQELTRQAEEMAREAALARRAWKGPGR